MNKIIATIGCSGSGKSTWSKEYCENIRTITSYISSDKIREELFGDANNQSDGKKVFDTLYSRVVEALQQGIPPIVDATHYNEKNRIRLEAVAKQNNATIEWHYFPVSLEEAKRRNQLRERIVPDFVIERQWKGLTLPFGENIIWHGERNKDQSLESYEAAVIVDLDGNLSLNVSGRSPYDGESVFEDSPREELVEILYLLDATNKYKIVFFSGRENIKNCRAETIRFLEEKCGIKNPLLYLRNLGDHRKDDLVKYEMWKEFLGDFPVFCVFDDRLQVCRMWYKCGLTLFRTGDPEANF